MKNENVQHWSVMTASQSSCPVYIDGKVRGVNTPTSLHKPEESTQSLILITST